MKATLLSLNGAPVWKIGNEIVTGFRRRAFAFPSCRKISTSGPRCCGRCKIRGARGNRSGGVVPDVESFLERRLRADRGDGRNSGDLDGWVTLVNHSGTAFKNARCNWWRATFIACAPPMDGRKSRRWHRLTAAAAAAPPFQQESFSEYHLYSLGRRTSIYDKETKQISLLNASPIPVRKVYVVNGQSYYYRSAVQPGAPVKDPVQVYLQIQERGESRPGDAAARRHHSRVPGGFARRRCCLSAKTTSTTRRRTKSISLHIGNAFDIVAERKQTDYKSISDRALRIRVRNHAAQPQGHAHHRGSERADRRRLGDGQLDVQIHEDGGVRRAISSARRQGRHVGAEVSRARALVGRDLGAALAAPRRGERRITNEMTTGPLRCRERIASSG